MWASIGAAIWSVIGPYVMPLLAAFAGDRYRAQADEIKQLKAENEQKQSALDLNRLGGSVVGSAARLRQSRWNRPD